MKTYANYAKASISMSKDDAFIASLDWIFSNFRITHIFESGTYLGLGSTTTLAKAVKRNNAPIEQFITVEIDAKSHSAARNNLKTFPFVTPVLGLTVPIDAARQFLESDEAIINHQKYPDIFIDTVEDPRGTYLRELDGKLTGNHSGNPIKRLYSYLKPATPEQDVLGRYLPAMADKSPLILLDSAGGIGYLEFQTVLKIMGDRPYFLVLDDIHHLKHFRSHRHIKEADDFTIIAESMEDGWLIAKHARVVALA